MPNIPSGSEVNAFVEAFAPDLRGVAEAVLTYLINETGVPGPRVLPDARICDELDVCDEDLDDVVVDVAARLNRVLPSPAELEGSAPVVTVRDVVAFIAGMRRA
jgi:hypothetical protein